MYHIFKTDFVHRLNVYISVKSMYTLLKRNFKKKRLPEEKFVEIGYVEVYVQRLCFAVKQTDDEILQGSLERCLERGGVNPKRIKKENPTPEEKREFYEKNCVICFDEKPTVIYQPCGHVVVCTRCHRKWDNFCPKCRTPISNYWYTYLEKRKLPLEIDDDSFSENFFIIRI